MNYITQKDKYRCGPVAIFNALLWAGEKVVYEKDMRRLTRLCECTAPKGTNYRPFLNTLRKEGRGLFTTELVLRPSMTNFDEPLERGCALAWNMKGRRGRHYALIVDRKNNFYDVANFLEGEVITTLSRKQLKQFVDQRDKLHRIWVLSKI